MTMASSYSLCCCCSLIVRMIVAILALFGVAFLLFFLVVNPHKMKVQVTEASFARFAFIEENETVWFDLKLHLLIRNPNRIIGFYYDIFNTRAYHQEEYILYRSTRPFFQARKRTTVVWIKAVDEQRLSSLDPGSQFGSRFGDQKRAGVFDIDVRSNLYVRAKIGGVRIGTFMPNFHCGLKIPLYSTTKRKLGVIGFNVTECQVEFKANSIILFP